MKKEEEENDLNETTVTFSRVMVMRCMPSDTKRIFWGAQHRLNCGRHGRTIK